MPPERIIPSLQVNSNSLNWDVPVVFTHEQITQIINNNDDISIKFDFFIIRNSEMMFCKDRKYCFD